MKTDLYIGQKLYHYAFGPMTITRIDDQYLSTTIDNRQGILLENAPLGADEDTRWFVNSVGHWIFTDPDMVGNINNEFKAPDTFYDMNLMRVVQQAEDPGNWHSYYGKKKTNKAKGSSPVGIVGKSADDSPVGVRGKNTTSESSPVGVIKK